MEAHSSCAGVLRIRASDDKLITSDCTQNRLTSRQQEPKPPAHQSRAATAIGAPSPSSPMCRGRRPSISASLTTSFVLGAPSTACCASVSSEIPAPNDFQTFAHNHQNNNSLEELPSELHSQNCTAAGASAAAWFCVVLTGLHHDGVPLWRECHVHRDVGEHQRAPRVVGNPGQRAVDRSLSEQQASPFSAGKCAVRRKRPVRREGNGRL